MNKTKLICMAAGVAYAFMGQVASADNGETNAYEEFDFDAPAELIATGCKLQAPKEVEKNKTHKVWVRSAGGTFSKYTVKVFEVLPTTGGWKHEQFDQRTSPSSNVSGTAANFFLPGYSYFPKGGEIKVQAIVLPYNVTCSTTMKIK
ncbi:hypothetical protein [Spartinivicinus poritis]|uniref:Secreted protein n=1 Tax=Spartinivicinus poritis TaxID=2994640 RepID=A0ABT5U5R5_9GAMM|nr:hypothetical protein [Spartinivicinus sp. A2-2]MDE1461707.1 hypothetical protein [Spartinivicinus sp. A2-2]